MTGRIGLTIQGLQPNQRILYLGSVAGTRAGHSWFTPTEVLDLFDALRLSRPGNILLSRSAPGAEPRPHPPGR